METTTRTPHVVHPDLVFVQYYLDCLSHASYLVGDRASGRAVVVDPQRDVSEYLADAEREGLTIERVIETHVHADFLSGHLEIAEATGAAVSYGSAAAVDFPIEPLADGQRLSLGTVELEVLHTPGHTPESICLVVRPSACAEPFGVLTGDTLFVGDVGRPDLLGAAGWAADDLARALYRSTRGRLLPLPDATRVFPAHGAGSACGKNLSTETASTIGDQRSSNYALADMSEDDFVALVTAGQSPAPAYFAHASTRNRQPRPILDEHADLPELADLPVGAVALDTRDPDEYAAGHLPGSVNVGLGGRFAELAGAVLPARIPIVLIGHPQDRGEARIRLARIGYDTVIGHIDITGRACLAQARRSESTDGRTVLDVRGPGETAVTGTVPAAVTIPLPELAQRASELDPHQPLVVMCAGGYRSSIAASLLRSLGFRDVTDYRGGYTAWQESQTRR